MAEISVTCPECGPTYRLVERFNHKTGGRFLGCPNWPACSHTQEVPLSIKMLEQGAMQLPGFADLGRKEPTDGSNDHTPDRGM